MRNPTMEALSPALARLTSPEVVERPARSQAEEQAIDAELRARAGDVSQRLTGLMMCATMLFIASGAALNWALPVLAACCFAGAVVLLVTARVKFRRAVVQCGMALGLSGEEARQRARTVSGWWWSDERAASS